MAELTLASIEKLLDKQLRPIKDDITNIKGDITNIKEGVTHLKSGITQLATQESLNVIGGRMITIEDILGQQTTTLDQIAKDASNWNTEMTVMRDRMKRYEDALKIMAEKLNLDITTLLH
jgi:hypothetical protein